MKICQLSGVGFSLHYHLRPLMHALRTEGHEVVGACAESEYVEQVRADGFRVETMPIVRTVDPLRNLRAVAALRRFFRKERFDLVHVHTPVAALVGRIAGAAAGVPRIVYTAHGFFFHENMPSLRRGVHISLEWCAGRATHTLFTQSGEDAETARRLKLCRTGDVLEIGNGSDPNVFRPADDVRSRQAVRAALGTPDERVVIMMIGRLVAEKGFREMIGAMRNVPAELWVAGGRLKSAHAPGIDDLLARVAHDPELESRIRFLGPRNDVPDLLRAADIFALPSHREGMPRSIIEAMLSGLPVVATDIRGSREEVVDGETGLLVPVRDTDALATALNRLVADGALRARLGQAGLERARALYDERLVIARQLDHLRLRA